MEEKSFPSSAEMQIEKKVGKGQIEDFVSGVAVAAGDEEVSATQPFSRLLVEDYGYPKANIQTRPQWRVKASPSAKTKGVPVDIAVFGSDSHSDSNLYMIVECKAPTESFDDSADNQLFNYLNWSSAEIGVWTNGAEHKIYHKVNQGGKLVYRQLPTLPKYGEAVSEIGRHVREDLRPPQNLQQIFRTIRAHLAGNAKGTTRDEDIAKQMINLIFCKIYDEKFTPGKEKVTFRAEVEESEYDILKRIDGLFRSVKLKYKEVFAESDVLSLDASSVKYVVGALQDFCLIEAGRDAIGEAFEVFVGGTLKGDQGQFFTPRNVIQLMVEIANPAPDAQTIDPACGAGGFLIETLRHKWASLEAIGNANGWSDDAIQEEKTSSAIKTIKGLDKDAFLVKVAKAYMAIMGDGKGSIYCEDSLDKPAAWESASWDIHLGSFDLVLANPPFGKEIKVRGEEKLEQYELARSWKRDAEGRWAVDPKKKVKAEMNPQVLFVERCLQLAKEGAKVGIILPETYFHSPTNGYVREFLLRRNNVVALIDLPHNTFRPFNNAKCIAVIVEKNRPQSDEILCIMAEEMGHNHQGKPIYREVDNENPSQIWDDITLATQAIRDGKSSEFVFNVPSREMLDADVFVPRYYWSKFNRDLETDFDYEVEWRELGSFIEDGSILDSPGHGSPSSVQKGKGHVPYVRVKDIVNWEVYRDPTSGVSPDVAEGMIKDNPLEVDDVVYVARGSYRIGDAAMVGPDDTNAVLTREIRRFRVVEGNDNDLTAFYLLYLLSSKPVQVQTKGRVFLDTTLPNIADRYRSLKLPWAKDKEVRDEISSKVESALRSKWEAMEDIRGLLNQ